MHVVIEGFSHGDGGQVLFDYPTYRSDPVELSARSLSPYLFDGPSDVVVAGRRTPISPSMPAVRYGSLPSDGGYLVVKPEDYPDNDAVATSYLHRYVGSSELVDNEDRWVIWAPEGPKPGDVGRSPFLKQRLEAVREHRRNATYAGTNKLSDVPYRFFSPAQPTERYIGIPAQVSETRRWYTVDYLEPDVIASNTLYTAIDPDGFLFGVLSSRMLVAWLATIGGRLESRYRYAKSIVHNTFPLPTTITDEDRQSVIKAGEKVRDVRASLAPASLAEMYEPTGMNLRLVQAHEQLDRAVERLFDNRKRKWTDDERLMHLINRYVELRDAEQLALVSPPAPKRRRKRRKS